MEKTKEQLINEAAEIQKKLNETEAREIDLLQENEGLKKLLDLIERAKQEWEVAADSLSQVICVLDSEGKVLRANFAVESLGLGKVKGIRGIGMHELFHGATDESNGLKMHEFFHPGCRDSSCYMVTLWSRSMEELTQNRPFEIEENDKVRNRWLFFQVLPTQASKRGKSKAEDSFAVVIVDDITKRKWAEEGLQKTEEEFRLTFENANDAIFWADVDTGIVIKCNKAGETLLERKREEILGVHQATLHPPEKSKYYTDMFKEHIEKKGVIDEEAEVITKSGKIKPVNITASVTLVGGKPIIQGIFHDITNRKQAEEELKNKIQELEKFHKFTVDRELRMKELKQRIKQLESRLMDK